MCNRKLPNIAFFLHQTWFIAAEPVTTAYLKKKISFAENRVFSVRRVFKKDQLFRLMLSVICEKLE